MPPPLKRSSTTPMSAQSVSVNGAIPVTALPAAGSSVVLLDNWTNENVIQLPANCKWVLFSSNVDFCVAYRNDYIIAGFPGALVDMANPGDPFPPDPDNTFGPGNASTTTFEMNPGLRDVSDYTNLCIMGLADGLLTVSYYSEL